MPSYASIYLRYLNTCLENVDQVAVDQAVGLIWRAWEDDRQVITFGNGGSALTALHFITDWNKAVHLATGKCFRGRSLVDNIGLLTAYANDVAYEDIFCSQLRNIAQPGDLVIAISGSGNSENVIRAVTVANKMGCQTLGLCGFSGGRLKSLAHHAFWVDVADMQICEDVHAIFGHIVMKALSHANRDIDTPVVQFAAGHQ